MAAIPATLLERRSGTPKRLADWLLERGHRPSLLEIEQERARRTPRTPDASRDRVPFNTNRIEK